MTGPWTKYAAGVAPSPAPGQPATGPWSKYAAPAAPAAPVDDSGLTGTPRALMLGVQGLGRAAADTAGMPVDLVSALLNGVSAVAQNVVNVPLTLAGGEGIRTPRIENPVGGSEWLQGMGTRIAEGLGVPMVEPQGTGETVAREVNRFGAGALAPAAGLARSGLAAGAQYAEGLGESAWRAARPYVADVTAGVGAGVGAGLTEDSESPTAKFLATLLGGVAGGGAFNVATAPREAAQWVDYAISDDPTVRPGSPVGPPNAREPAPAGTSRMVADEARKALQRDTVDPVAAAEEVTTGAQRFRDAGMAVPTSGVLSNDEGLIALERRQRRSVAAPAFSRSDRAVAQSAADKVGALDPGADVNARDATGFVQRQVGAIRQQEQAKVDQARGAAEQAEQSERDLGAGLWRPAGTGDQASRDLDKAIVDETLRPAQQRMDGLRSEIDPDGTDMRPHFAPAAVARIDRAAEIPGLSSGQTGARDILGNFDGLFEDKPILDAAGEPILDDAGVPKTQRVVREVPVRDQQRLRPFLAEAIRREGEAGNVTKRKALSALKRALDKQVQDLADEGDTTAAEYLRAHAEEFAPVWNEGEAGRLRKDVNADPTRSKTPPTATAGRFLRTGPGSAEAAQSLRKILDSSKSREAGDYAAREYLSTRLAGVVDSNGKVNVVRLNKWLDAHDGALAQFPELRAEIRQLRRDVVNGREASTRMQRDLEAAVGRQKRTEQQIGDSALSVMLDSDPVVAVRRVFSSSDPERAMAQITATVDKDKVAGKAWRKAVSEYLQQTLTKTASETTADGSRNVSLAEVANLFTKHERVLAKVYTPEQMDNLRQAHLAVKTLSRRMITGGGPGTSTAEDAARALDAAELGLTAQVGAFKAARALRSIKLVQKITPGLDVEFRSRELLTRAMFDPELMATLLTTPTTQPGRVAWSRRIAALLATGEMAREASDSDSVEGGSGADKVSGGAANDMLGRAVRRNTGPQDVNFVFGERAGSLPGSYRGEDGRIRNPATEDITPKPAIGGVGRARLGDLIDSGQLFRLYPELRDAPVVLGSGEVAMDSGTLGGVAEDGTIYVRSRQEMLDAGYSPEEADSLLAETLIHEVQHKIQKAEGWPGGGSPRTAISDFEVDSKWYEDPTAKRLEIYGEQLARSKGSEQDANYSMYRRLSGEQEAFAAGKHGLKADHRTFRKALDNERAAHGSPLRSRVRTDR